MLAKIPHIEQQAKLFFWKKRTVFSMKLKNLSEILDLSESQQAQVKPILQQESGELGPFWNNPVISRKDKLAGLEKIARASDAKIKPLLSATQIQKLQEMHKEQKQELKKEIAKKMDKIDADFYAPASQDIVAGMFTEGDDLGLEATLYVARC
jgi:hypothetical protein